ncbi:hypothetical protein CSV63_07315 [Sporosarcina sp. P34]|uniref:hypothetical protein n=1 Tax=Sporosarcina sp. P34 TaxID=2048247 RepID=UPI000C167E7E|nr:hypothetical protein [Sporosarcina sp. P34]PID15581.1 hypothetical protein CSV63_07315 [Sporosarcina sp. P34]
MTTNVNIEDADVNILLTIDGNMHLVAMRKDDLEAIRVLVKSAASKGAVVKTEKTQKQFNDFLGYGG